MAFVPKQESGSQVDLLLANLDPHSWIFQREAGVAASLQVDTKSQSKPVREVISLMT